MSAQPAEEGGGIRATPAESDTSTTKTDEVEGEIQAVAEKIEKVEKQIEEVEGTIKKVEETIEKVEVALSGVGAYQGVTDTGVLWKEEEQLRRKKEQLRTEKEQLRRKKEQLRDGLKQVRENKGLLAFNRPADKSLTEFAAALTEAVVTNSTLELANGTFFLGNSRLGSKLFIRPCYTELSEILLGGAWTKSTVVSGTPGIGKSCFALYLLYLLRCKGTTVVFEVSGNWYRFSNEGVMEGTFYDFVSKGYLDDETAWYLSDPEDRPYKGFRGVTVVFVSPNYYRTNEFLKIDEAVVFMPVWTVTELLDCRLAVYPHVPVAVVEERCRIVGGVARAVFQKEKFQLAKKRIETLVTNLDARMLEDAPDELFHIFSESSDNFKGYHRMLASDYADDLLKESVQNGDPQLLLLYAMFQPIYHWRESRPSR